MELAIIIIFTLLLVLLGSSFASIAAYHAEPLPCRRPQRRSPSSSELIITTSTTTARRIDRCFLFERTIAASSSSIGEENVDQLQTTDAVVVPYKKYQEITDKMEFVEQTEHIPLGQLTQDIERNMLSLMRQLSHMGRRHDDTISSSYLADGAVRSTTLISSKKDTYLHNGTLPNAQQRRQDAALVGRLLDRLEKEYQYSVDNTDGVITEQWGNDDDDDDDTNKRRRRTHQSNVISARIYNLAIKAWADANIRGSAEKAERVLKRLKIAERRIGQRGRTSHGPDIYSFAYCYAAWYKESIFASKQVDSMKASTIALRKAESVLQSMKQILMLRKTAGDGRIVNEHERNIAEDINSLLTMWSTADPTLPDLQETFLRFVEGESRDLADIWLNTRSFNLVINAWAKSGRTESVSRSEALLQIMEMSHKISPNLLSYSGVISCIANSNRSADVARAECILDLLTDGKSAVQPDTVLFNQVLNIYCKQGSRGATEKCEALLERMENLVENGNYQVCPDVRTHNLLISAYANELGPAEAEAALRRLEMHPSIQPDLAMCIVY